MNRNDIIRLAREAEVPVRGHYDEQGLTPQELQRFAALAIAAERERVTFDLVNEAQRAVQEAVWAEREACAEVCDAIDVEYEGEDVLATRCAEAIRARGEE